MSEKIVSVVFPSQKENPQEKTKKKPQDHQNSPHATSSIGMHAGTKPYNFDERNDTFINSTLVVLC